MWFGDFFLNIAFLLDCFPKKAAATQYLSYTCASFVCNAHLWFDSPTCHNLAENRVHKLICRVSQCTWEPTLVTNVGQPLWFVFTLYLPGMDCTCRLYT